MAGLKVRDVMSTDIRGINEDASLLAAAKVMVDQRVNSLVVWPKDRDEPFGIVTSSDIVDAIGGGRSLEETCVSDMESTPLVVVTPGVPVPSAARMMSRLGLRHLAVFNGKTLVGIVSNLDLLRAATGGVRPGGEEVTTVL